MAYTHNYRFTGELLVKTHLMVLFMVLAGTAGCLTGEQDEATNDPGEVGSSTTSSEEKWDGNKTPLSNGAAAAESNDPSGRDTSIELTNCFTLDTNTDAPTAIHPGQHPPSWAKESPIPLTKTRYYFLECERISWLAFERGPVHFVIEGHTKVDPPQRCTGGQADFRNIVEFIGVDDSDLAQAMRNHLGLQVHVIQASYSTTNNAGLDEHHVVWQSDLLGATGLRTYSEGEPEGRFQYQGKFYLVDGDRVFRLDLDRSAAKPVHDSHLAQGNVGAGTLYAQMFGSQFQAISDVFEDVSATLSITAYGDIQCSEKLY